MLKKCMQVLTVGLLFQTAALAMEENELEQLEQLEPYHGIQGQFQRIEASKILADDEEDRKASRKTICCSIPFIACGYAVGALLMEAGLGFRTDTSALVASLCFFGPTGALAGATAYLLF